jgi:hypothetical protein
MNASLRINLLTLLFSCSLLVASCGKSSAPTPKQLSTRGQLLTTPKWRMTSSVENTVTPAGIIIASTDLYPIMHSLACGQDDFIKFGTDGYYADDQGLIKCVPGSQQASYVPWHFEADETGIIIAEGFTPHKITKLTSTELSLVTTDIGPDGNKLIIISTYVTI